MDKYSEQTMKNLKARQKDCEEVDCVKSWRVSWATPFSRN